MSTLALTASAEENAVSEPPSHANAHAHAHPHSKEGRPARPSFVTIDINSDGGIDFDEFSSHPPPKKRQKRIFAAIDQDNNGVISKAEFIRHKPRKKKGRR